jgi:phage gp36-like protein
MYATAVDFELAFGSREALQLSNRDNAATATAVNAAVLEEFLEGASGLIDSYLGARYLTPVLTPTQPLKQACLDIARYNADNVRVREDVRQRYEDRIRWLEQVTKGLVELGLPGIPGLTPVSGSNGLGLSRSSVLPPLNLRGFGFHGQEGEDDRHIRGSNYY